MAKLAAKVINPITIEVVKDNITIISNAETIKLNDKLDIKNEHYGFILTNKIDDVEHEIAYPTQGLVKKVEVKDGILNVYEKGIYYPWMFNNNGELLNDPTIDTMYNIEVGYSEINERNAIKVYIKK